MIIPSAYTWDYGGYKLVQDASRYGQLFIFGSWFKQKHFETYALVNVYITLENHHF